MSGGDPFGLDKAARREALNNVEAAQKAIPVALNPALPGVKVAFDWRFFGVTPTQSEVQES